MLPNLTIVIPFRNGHPTIEQLLGTLPADLPVVLVDDVSPEPYVSKRRNVLTKRLPARGYFSGAVNEGLRMTQTDVLVLNQDVWLEGTGWADLIADRRETAALIGDGVMAHPAWPEGYVQGTFMFMRRDAIQGVGLLNERDYPLWGATAEWQLRACRKGFKALPTEVSGLRHARTGPFGSAIDAALRDQPESRQLFVRTPPAISVIITSYQYGRYLRDAVHSLVGGDTVLGPMPGQTFASFEVIIVDDASKDSTAEVGKALADASKGIRYIRMPQWGGSAVACNVGARASYGHYLTMLDADDMMEPDRLEALYRIAELNPHSVVYDDPMVVTNGRRTEPWPLPPYDFDMVLKKNPMHKGILYPKRAWAEVGGYPEVMNKGREDWAFNIALGAKGWCGIHLAQPLYLYRREGQNRSLDNAGPEWRNRFLAQLQTLYPNLYAGDRPMGCCGSNRAKNAPAQLSRAAGGRSVGALNSLSLPGEQGMVLLEYLVQVSGPQTHYGAVTHQTYVFGGQRKVGYVDARDVPQFLQMMVGRSQAFRIAPPPPVPAPAPAAVAAPEPAAVVGVAVAEMPAAAPEVAEVPVADEPVAKPKRGRPKKAADAD